MEAIFLRLRRPKEVQMEANKSTVSTPLASPNYDISMRLKEIQRPNGTDIVCIGTLCHNGKPVAAVAPKQRTVHYDEDIPAAIRQIANVFEHDIRNLSTRSSPQKMLQPLLSKTLYWRASAVSARANSQSIPKMATEAGTCAPKEATFLSSDPRLCRSSSHMCPAKRISYHLTWEVSLQH